MPHEAPEHPCTTCGLAIPAGLVTCANGHAAPHRVKLQCDCCGQETLAERVGNKVVIRRRCHGRDHVLIIPLENGDAPLYHIPLEFKDILVGG